MYFPPPPPAETRATQTMPVCGSIRAGTGEIVTPDSIPSGMGCSAPVGDGGQGYVRIKPTAYPTGVRVVPDQFVMPNYGQQ